MKHRNHRLGVLLVTASAVIWSTAGLFTRLIDAGTGTVLFWRGVFGAAGLAVFALLWNRRGILPDIREMGWPGWLFAVVSAFAMILFITSLRLTSVAHVAIIYAAVPFIAGGMAWIWMGEPMSRNAIIASFAALAGITVMVGFDAGLDGLLGDVLAFSMTICMGAMMVITRRHHNVPLLPAAGFSAALSAIAALPFAGELMVVDSDWVFLVCFGLINSALGFALFMIGSRLLPASETGLIGALDAPLAPIWVWLIFVETPGPATFIGGGIVFIAVFAHIIAGMRARSPAMAGS